MVLTLTLRVLRWSLHRQPRRNRHGSALRNQQSQPYAHRPSVAWLSHPHAIPGSESSSTLLQILLCRFQIICVQVIPQPYSHCAIQTATD